MAPYMTSIKVFVAMVIPWSLPLVLLLSSLFEQTTNASQQRTTVATANNIESLPAEILRKGRFDEIFFVGLPSQEEREAIFNVHLSRLRPHNYKDYDIKRLAYETLEFSGAEIEQTIIEAMHLAFSQNRDFTSDDIVTAASQIVPLALTAKEQIEFLQNWASSGKARLASGNPFKLN